MRPNSGTANARYCYSVWLRHLVLANKYKLVSGVPDSIAELGPGNSLGTGLAALISGGNKYYAFDVIKHTKKEENIHIFNNLVTLFNNREQIPNNEEFPHINTKIDEYKFPSNILSDKDLSLALNEKRINNIRNDLLKLEQKGNNTDFISYVIPWNTSDICNDTIDMIFSMSVLEHIDDLESTYKAAYSWLKMDGFMSHEIDFKCHGHANKWNGHWCYSDFTWRIIRGCRPYFINRYPHSLHIRALKNNGFSIILNMPSYNNSGVSRNELSRRFKNLSDDDICTSNAYILAKK